MLAPGTRVHFIGIGGTGLSAIARVLLEQGFVVSGCDLSANALTEGLAASGAQVWIGHDPAHLAAARAEAVVVTSAAPAEHAEVAAARAQGLPVLKRADFLGELMAPRRGVAVAGTHGKTTTTGMLSYVLMRAGLDPTFIAGGTLRDLRTNARAGQGAPFVIEADEYDRTFLGLKPQLAVVTNMEHDHPDTYPTYADLRAAFEQFVNLLPADGLLVACAEDIGARALAEARRAQGRPVVLYGFERGDWQAHEVQVNPAGGCDARVVVDGAERGVLHLVVPGRHNVLNALAALAAAGEFGVDFAAATAALAGFHGVERRFEVRGQAGGVTVIDDYGHHPTEIRATLVAARMRYPHSTLWAVWQPHTYSRTRALLDEFAAAFDDADHVVVTGIYASREHDTLGLTAEAVVARMRHPDARAIGSLRSTARYLREHLKPGDVLVVFSAGDATQVSELVLSEIELGRPGAAGGAES